MSKFLEPTEHQIMVQILDHLRLLGAWVQRMNSGSIFATDGPNHLTNKVTNGKVYKVKLADYGTPDIIGILNGKFFGIEVKRNKKLAEEWHKQKKYRDQAQKASLVHIIQQGGHGFLVYSFEDYISQFQEEAMFTNQPPKNEKK